MDSAARRLVASAWLRTLGGGLALYLLVTIATVATGNLHLVPSLIMIGALLTVFGLHSLWDGTSFLAVRGAVALASLALLSGQLRAARRWTQRDRSRYPTPRTVSMLSVPKGRSSFSRR